MGDPIPDARLAEIARVHASVDRFPFTSDRYGVRDVDGDRITDSYGLFWTEELAEFVALSSTAVPELLAEVRRLREENERLRAEAGKLEREREASIAVCEGLSRTQGCPPMPPGAIVVRDDEATRERIARACFEFDRGETWSERTNSDEKTYTEEADAVLAALREAYQRGEQDSRGNPMPCLHLDEAAAVVAALREAYQDSRGNPDSIEERQNALRARKEEPRG